MKNLALKFLLCCSVLFSGWAQAEEEKGNIPNTEFEYSITYSRTNFSKFASRNFQHRLNLNTAYEITILMKTPDGEFSFPKTKVVAGDDKVWTSVNFKGITYVWQGKVSRLYSEGFGKDIFEWTLLEKDEDGEKSTVFGPFKTTLLSYKR